MRKFIIGFMIGLILGGTCAWAATGITLRNGSGDEVGTTTNPLVVATP